MVATPANATAIPARRGSPSLRNDWLARENTNGRTGKMHGLMMVSIPPRYARTNWIMLCSPAKPDIASRLLFRPMLDLLWRPLQVKWNYLDLPVQRNGGRHIADFPVTCLILQFSFDRYCFALAQRANEVPFRGKRYILADAKFACENGNTLLDRLQEQDLRGWVNCLIQFEFRRR